MDDSRKPEPGTYGALTRSTTPWPWRRLLAVATFTAEEFAREGPSVIMRKGQAMLDELRRYEAEHDDQS